MTWQEQKYEQARRKIENIKNDKSLTDDEKQYLTEQTWCNVNQEIRDIQKEMS